MTPQRKSSSTLRASEVGAYLFCRRAWSYQRLGIAPAASASLEAGVAWHRRHGRRVLLASGLRTGGWILILLAAAGVAVLAAQGLTG
jgi:hypothetical protein